ncbi:MAG: tyrosine--tRNA ligase [Candidatus Staskawiczbacteria bacterium RIFCSPHIGHO2_02_FULL_42_22]|uniref:Tyrosine--tRNA ligase n=1 Tax=Candidatus Staskawiczbacteria bacterium RIFCSPHIGHO2_02_FULL_42_22 TaxID=1802207 RepID=A0A1G2I4H4_9BACT|nr:MAG: tyrosine--tRNA ligase [Candidatus Staskawiczbacteria bacterium RIFCSPHIGHO2_02_FULL_42_22]
MINSDLQKIEETLSRGVEEVIDRQHLEKKLLSGKVLRIKLGIDPTSPNIHIGRAIPLLKLRDFQNLGHKVVLIIGDFTGIIGDTSDKESERPMLDQKTIKENMKTYVGQAAKILDIKKCEIKYNSTWLKKLGFLEIANMANVFGLHEFSTREVIAKRMNAGKRVSYLEMMYPLMQGYDSVATKADVELGGTDQRFNLLAGRDIQKHYGQEPQDVMTNPLIEGLDGRKMSSSWQNTINLFDSPDEMFGKTMSLPDELIAKYFTLVTRVSLSEIEKIKKMPNPRDQKALLAKEIVKMYHSEPAAQRAEEEFNKMFRDKELPSEIEFFQTDRASYPFLDLLCDSGLAPSKNEAKRLVEGRAVKINGQVQEDWQKIVTLEDGIVIQVGKRKFIKIKLT